MEIRDEEKQSLIKVYQYILHCLDTILVGQKNVKKVLAATLMCDTNARLIMSGEVGAGKTSLAKFVASMFNYERISISSDLLPSDIENRLKIKENLEFLLLEELNRASGKTQSGLLEMLEENQLTGEEVHKFNDFYVFATQNNSDVSGIFPIPEAVYDRFDVNLYFEDLTEEERRYILFGGFTPSKKIETNVDFDIRELLKCTKDIIENTPTSEQEEDILMKAFSYIRDMKKGNKKLIAGTNIRGEMFAIKLAKTMALTSGRSFIIPTDIAEYIKYLYMHRINQSIASIGEEEVNNQFDEVRSRILDIKFRMSKRGR